MRILAATGNRFKLEELRAIGEKFGVQVLSPGELKTERNLSEPPTIDESALDYAGNALLKALAYAKWGSCDVIADDSGIEVDALGGRPGVHSARYAGEGATDEMLQEKLLGELAALEQTRGPISRSARYRCFLVGAFWNSSMNKPEEKFLTASSVLEGEILRSVQGREHQPHGNHGYNPIVFIPEFGCTLSQLPFEQVVENGFRAIAAKSFFEQYLRWKK